MTSQLQDFIRESEKITMTAEYINVDYSDPNYPHDNWKYPHDNWKITIHYDGKEFSPGTNYKTGIGCRVCAVIPKSAVKKERGGYYNSYHSEFLKEQEAMVKWFKPVQPTTADVLCAFLSDASGASETHESWCVGFGYSADSIKGLNIYLECQKIRDGLIKLFGYQLFEKLCTLEH